MMHKRPVKEKESPLCVGVETQLPLQNLKIY